MENGTQMTFEEYMPETFQKQTVGASDSLVRTYPLQESKPDFKETVQACFSELCTLSDSSKKKINPLTFSLRTLRICLVLMEDGISPDCSLKWSRGGYDTEWQVLNSKDFGVPQNRERCFIIGHLRSRSSAKVFPIERKRAGNIKQIIGGRQGERVYDINGTSPTITGESGGFGGKTGLYFIDQSKYKPKITNTARCLVAKYTAGVSNYQATNSAVLEVYPVLTPERIEKRQNGRRIKEDGEPMFTLTSQDRHGIYTCGHIRRLTPKECFRLQGWTDDYFEKAEFVNSDSQLYKQAGNGVTVNVIKAIAERMKNE